MPKISSIFTSLTSTIHDALQVIDKGGYAITLVVDQDHKLLGTITDGDIRRATLANIPLTSPLQTILERKASTIYAQPVTALSGQERSLYFKLMKEKNLLHLPILNEKGCVVDLVTMDDFTSASLPSLRAVVMAGGKGTRLQPLTLDTPKSMLQVGNKPLIDIIIKQLRSSGIHHVNISTHHHQEKLTKHLKDGSELNVSVSYISEDMPLGTAGALGLIEKSNETTLVINGDILTNLDFRTMISYHRENEADLTIAVRQYDFKVPYGVVECQGHAVKAITEKPRYSFFVNAGIYLLEPSVFEHVPAKGQRFDMTELIQRLIAENRTVVSFPILEQWLDIGQPADYAAAQDMVATWVDRK
ncbi:MAG: Glucose-1-phosphate adenylyltransferase [Elusimicrobia bacterium]|nr:Glucose-1-phosphate adenylyltransferase [Elusimicrobiota bacterium]